MPFEAENTSMPGVILLKPRVFEDQRGHFLEAYNARDLQKFGINDHFVQDNQSLSAKNVLRGFHFQAPPHAQAKLVRVVRGRVLDVVLDLRKGSETYGQTYAKELSGDNFLQLYIPEGFAHAFLSLEEDTLVEYKCNRFYHKASEGGIHWNDPDLGVEWGVTSPSVSEKDEQLPLLQNFKSPFDYGKEN